MTTRSILGVFAHPDDECMGPGGTLAKYAAAGHRVAFITATEGGAGRLYDERPADDTELRRTRRAETQNSADILGIDFLGFLGWQDQRLQDLNILDVEQELAIIVRTWRPDVLITFHGSGISHHPDHRVMWLALMGAFFGSARAGWYRDERVSGLEPHRPQKLYTYTLRRSVLDDVDWPREIYSSPDDEVTTVIDTSKEAVTRWQAIRAHASQSGGPPFERLYRAGVFDEEAFVRVASTGPHPPPSKNERCILDGLTAS